MENNKRKETKMIGVILAGGFGTRLRPLTLITNKHLLPVYDRPMIYYPIETLRSAGIYDIMIVTGSESAGDFVNLLGNGEEFGINISYRIQKGAGGIAEALGLCKNLVGDSPMVVILGDNIFFDNIKEHVDKFKQNYRKAMIFLKEVDDPTRFGVATVKDGFVEKVVEKPNKPESNLAVTGCYFYNPSVWHIIELLKPSDRGELEITDVNNWYINNGGMSFQILDDFWSDAGTIESLYRASTAVRNQKLKPSP